MQQIHIQEWMKWSKSTGLKLNHSIWDSLQLIYECVNKLLIFFLISELKLACSTKSRQESPLNKSHTCLRRYYKTTNHNQGTPFFLRWCGRTHTNTHTELFPDKGLWLGLVCGLLLYTGDNGTVCSTHVPQQSTEQLFEETPSHGRSDLAATPSLFITESPTITSLHFHTLCIIQLTHVEQYLKIYWWEKFRSVTQLAISPGCLIFVLS